MSNVLTRYSRAGDAFQYRWAARRCLRMIDPMSGLGSITVEASKSPELPGEYAIDLAEYYGTAGRTERTAYYQLKHSTVRVRTAMTWADLQPTLVQFGKRFRAEESRNRGKKRAVAATYSVVTNRKVAEVVKQAVREVAVRRASAAERTKLERATGLKGGPLRRFCAALRLVDDEGDYVVQRRRLHGEMAEVLAGFVDSDETDQVASLVASRVLPDTPTGEITPEAVLQRLGVNSSRDLFPASPAFERLVRPIKREQHEALLRHVLAGPAPALIHADGGVGKSVVARLVADSLPVGSQAILYDCFGAGKYRSPCEPRHRARDALVQMANELAARGLCPRLLPQRGLAPDDFFVAFRERLASAIANLRAVHRNAVLVLLIDAADNAEMAAREFSDPCFANALLRETLPAGCRLAMFCRTERIDLLKPAASVRRFELKTFSEAESRTLLRTRFRHASDQDGREFHRLSGGNPRVQSNALGAGQKTVEAVLLGLGPEVTTVDSQIAGQLRAAIDRVKEPHGPDFSTQIDALCYGLANLPPLIPIPVLAQAAGVSPGTVKSFIADLGRPLWHSDDAVQFRDEPTETWFQREYAADAGRIARYVVALEPLAGRFVYVAKALPLLLLRAGEHARLISLALSEELLPKNSPIDERNVRVYRLQFAFKAALRLGRHADAVRLAFRAGEEAAGNQRQIDLLAKNVDLVALLEDTHRIQELAYRQVLGGGWPGCENVYSAALLSSVPDFKGEARAYQRSAYRWLRLYFEDRAKVTEPHHRDEALKDAHLVELAWAHYHLGGAASLLERLEVWRPRVMVFRVMRVIVRRLVDVERFAEIEAFGRLGRRLPFLALAIAEELGAVARLPAKDWLQPTLAFLAFARIELPNEFPSEGDFKPAILSFLEACAARGLPRTTILRALKRGTPPPVLGLLDSDHQEGGRAAFLRSAVLRAVLTQQPVPTVAELLPKPKKGEPVATRDRERENAHQMLEALRPWHELRMRALVAAGRMRKIDLAPALFASGATLDRRHRNFDRLPYEVMTTRFSVLAWHRHAAKADLDGFAAEITANADRRMWLGERLEATRTAMRCPHLAAFRAPLEQSCAATLKRPGEDRPEDRADGYVSLGRAVLPRQRADALAYFRTAVDAVSKFGDEMVERWEAVVAMARRSAAANPPPSLAYRFLRCAEMIGETVDREKYWNRRDVFRVAVLLDPAGTFAALSRWRDRDVAFFDDLIAALAVAAVEGGTVAARVGWCLSGFEGCNHSVTFAATCLRRENDAASRRELFDRSVRDLELAEVGREDWDELRAVARELGLPAAGLDQRAATAPPDEYGYTPPLPRGRAKAPRSPATPPGRLLRGIDPSDAAGLHRALVAFEASGFPREPEAFWRALLARVTPGREAAFLELLPAEAMVDCTAIGTALGGIQALWRTKAAVDRVWPEFMAAVGRRFATELSNYYRLNYWREQARLGDADVLHIRRGMLAGLAESPELMDAGTFFGYIVNAANDLTPAEAREVLDFALDRFERHLDPELGDGPWADWLAVPADPTRAVTGLLWVALGSPYAEVRWQAAHCVRRLGELGCAAEIAALLDWSQRGTAEAFASRRLPFYALHAKLYLLIALARVAVERAGTLAPHAAFFAATARSGLPHFLIQTFAADIALAIERACAGTYSAAVIAELQQVGRSQLPVREVKGGVEQFDSPGHAAGTVDKSLAFHFGMDFDDYWLRPLGEVFGVPKAQMVELAREVVVRELGIPGGDDYRPDPRQDQWNSRERDSSIYKSSYSRTDDFRYYASYHAMLSVAARLLSAMPVLRRADPNWNEDRWADWRERHALTRADGRWLADRRDPLPAVRRDWRRCSSETHRMCSVDSGDFLDVQRRQCPLPGGLCVDGYWTDYRLDMVETVRIASALVDPRAAESLATALRWSRGRYDYHLPWYGRDHEDFGAAPFDLTGWILEPAGGDDRLDSFDPYAKLILYPPLEIGADFVTRLGLAADGEKREWRQQADGKLAAVGETWSDRRPPGRREREERYRSGRRLSASLPLLRRLCVESGKELVISVDIDRSLANGYGSAKFENVPSSHQIFLLSAHGRLRDAKKIYRLG